MEDDIRFLEVDPDASYEELIIAVGKVFIETYVIRFEDQDNHHITLKTSDDLKIAIRQHEKAEPPYPSWCWRGRQEEDHGVWVQEEEEGGRRGRRRSAARQEILVVP